MYVKKTNLFEILILMLKMDRCKEGKTVGANKQTSVRKEGQSRGWKCEDGQECVLMMTGL